MKIMECEKCLPANENGREQSKNNLRRLFETIDGSNRGCITNIELTEYLNTLPFIYQLQFDYGLSRPSIKKIMQISQQKRVRTFTFDQFDRKIQRKRIRDLINAYLFRNSMKIMECEKCLPANENGREQSKNNIRRLFETIDGSNRGCITNIELTEYLNTLPFIYQLQFDYGLSRPSIKKIMQISQQKRVRTFTFDQFDRKIQRKRIRDLINAYLFRYKRFLFPRMQTFDGYSARYEDEISCKPPPLTMLVISTLEVMLFFVNMKMPTIATYVQYDPRRRAQVWRFVTYMFVHIGTNHLMVNLCVQLFLGVMLEVVHRWWQVALVYFSGVLAGSLVSSVVEPDARLVGASGGVYSFLTAHIAAIILNYNDMENPVVLLTVFLIIVCTDVGISTYKRYVWHVNDHVGYAAHFGGALAGLLVGLVVLRNLEVNRCERVLQRVSLVTFVAILIALICWNLVRVDYLPVLSGTSANYRWVNFTV